MIDKNLIQMVKVIYKLYFYHIETLMNDRQPIEIDKEKILMRINYFT